MSTDEYVPDEDEVRYLYVANSYSDAAYTTDKVSAEFDRFLARVKRDAKAEAWDAFREGLAGHLDLATPRAWGFHHPCDPPGVRWEPTERGKALMDVADMLREDTANPYRDTHYPEETP